MILLEWPSINASFRKRSSKSSVARLMRSLSRRVFNVSDVSFGGSVLRMLRVQFGGG